MNHRHRKVLHSLFAHPLNHNIDPRAVEAVLEDLGADVSTGGAGQTTVRLNGQQVSLRLEHHSLAPEEVMTLRRFLTAAEVDLTAYPA